MKKVTIYTDGSCEGNPGRGGWAAILRYNKKDRVLTGGSLQTTNNRMEMTAALKALQLLKEPCAVKLHTDSQYLRRAFTDGWLHRWHSNGWLTSNKQPVKNQDLWKDLWSEAQKHEVQWIKVKAHANNKLNNRADALAVAACQDVARELE